MIDLKEMRRRAMWLPDVNGAIGPTFASPSEVIALLDMLEAAQKDAARLMFACEFDGYEGVQKDKYDYASELAERAGRDEPSKEDEINGLRALIDAAMARKD